MKLYEFIPRVGAILPRKFGRRKMKIFIGIITYIVVVIFGLMFFYGTKPRNNDKGGSKNDNTKEDSKTD